MKEMAPTIPILPVDNSSGSRMIFTLLVLCVIVSVQTIMIIKANSKIEKFVSIALVPVAILTWVLRFR